MWSIPRRRGAGADAIFVRVAASITDDIRRGARRAGDRLPSTRALAAELGVNRNTVVAAYDELAAQGWVVTRGPAGTRVADDIPERPVRAPRAPRGRSQAGMADGPGFGFDAVPAHDAAPFGPAGARYQLSVGVP